jgi:hypothetical protein
MDANGGGEADARFRMEDSGSEEEEAGSQKQEARNCSRGHSFQGRMSFQSGFIGRGISLAE